MKVFRVLPDLTLLHVVLLRVLETLFKVLLDLVEERILSMLQPTPDLVESYRSLDLLVVIWILSFRRQTKEVVRQKTTSSRRDTPCFRG